LRTLELARQWLEGASSSADDLQQLCVEVKSSLPFTSGNICRRTISCYEEIIMHGIWQNAGSTIVGWLWWDVSMFRGFVMVAMFRKKCVHESEMVLFMRVRDLLSTQTHQSQWNWLERACHGWSDLWSRITILSKWVVIGVW
jgi:hypothetical protein